ncbi:MAG: hypothetical protein IPO01_14830 [Chitinophagaceae bacterium]|nr:hypothetical protein [Chitinophagaceae bacterium]MBK9486407.1 hypothetical protein [Chitinophagaceae bacterium]
MRKICLIGIFLLNLQNLKAQTVAITVDSVVVVPVPDYITSIYNPKTHTENLSYNYSGKWDFDGDNKVDSIYFIGDTSILIRFFLRLKLSTDTITRDFYTVHVDLPYLYSLEEVQEREMNSSVGFIVYDFNQDGISDIYLNFDNTFSQIPQSWSENGVNSKRVILNHRNGKLTVKNYIP